VYAKQEHFQIITAKHTESLRFVQYCEVLNSVNEENQDLENAFGAESFVFQFANQKYNDYEIPDYFCVLFSMGVKLGLSHEGRHTG
jgi:hypothetical protein